MDMFLGGVTVEYMVVLASDDSFFKFKFFNS